MPNDPEAPQLALDAPGGDTPAPQPLPDNLDVEELLALGADAQPSTAAADSPGDEEDDDDDQADDDEEDDDGADEDDEAAGEDDESEPPTRPLTPEAIEQSVRQAADKIAQDPGSTAGVLRSLPKAQRGPAMEEALRLAYIGGVSDAHAALTARSTQEQELRDFLDERMAARDSKPDEYLVWEDENPEDAAKVAQARAYFKAKAEGKNPALPGEARPAAAANGGPKLTESQQTIQNLANREGPRLQALPQDAQARIAAKGFALTEDGLDAFRQAISEEEAAARRSTNAPAAAARRQQAHEDRLRTARVDAGQRGNAAPPKRNPIADIDDVDALLDMEIVGASNRR